MVRVSHVLTAVLLATLAQASSPVPQKPAAGPPTAPSGVEAVLGAVLGPSPLADDLDVLCNSIGGRPTGSPAMARAVDWAVERFQAAGVDTVAREPFQMPLRWEEGATAITIIEPERFGVRAVSAAWSPATPDGGLTARLRDAGRGTEDDLARLGPDVKGAILLVMQDEMRTLGDLFAEYIGNVGVLTRAAKAGAAAVLFTSTRPRLLLYRHQQSFGGLGPIPSAIVAREDALRIFALLGRVGAVKARIDLPNQVGGPFTAHNVVADIRGRERPDEMVILGAHLDSWDLGTGALDNGASSAMVIDVARAMVQSGQRPRRTVRFILFNGEEQGLIGSRAYVRDHLDEMDRIAAVVIYDTGVGRVSGYYLGGRPDVEVRLRSALEPVAALGVTSHPPDAFVGTDNFDFLLEGVPTLVASLDTTGYLPEYHATSDTLDKVDLRELKVQAAVAAVTTYRLAEAQEPLGRRLDGAGVAEIVRTWHLRQQMEPFQIWQDYMAGHRGRRPPPGAFGP